MSEQNQTDSTFFDEIVYAETRNINIGDYESRTVFMSLKTRVKKINKKNNTISIHASERVSLDSYEKDVKKSFIHAKKVVRERLDAEERKIRLWAEEFTGDYLLNKLENPPK